MLDFCNGVTLFRRNTYPLIRVCVSTPPPVHPLSNKYLFLEKDVTTLQRRADPQGWKGSWV